MSGTTIQASFASLVRAAGSPAPSRPRAVAATRYSFAVPAGHAGAVPATGYAKHSSKCTGMTLIDTNVWPLGPREKSSG